MKSVLGFREVMDFRFGYADTYFVCVLDALTDEIDI